MRSELLELASRLAARGERFCCGGCRTKFLADPARYPTSAERAHCL
jgi:hypothetical protein